MKERYECENALLMAKHCKKCWVYALSKDSTCHKFVFPHLFSRINLFAQSSYSSLLVTVETMTQVTVETMTLSLSRNQFPWQEITLLMLGASSHKSKFYMQNTSQMFWSQYQFRTQKYRGLQIASVHIDYICQYLLYWKLNLRKMQYICLQIYFKMINLSQDRNNITF